MRTGVCDFLFEWLFGGSQRLRIHGRTSFEQVSETGRFHESGLGPSLSPEPRISSGAPPSLSFHLLVGLPHASVVDASRLRTQNRLTPKAQLTVGERKNERARRAVRQTMPARFRRWRRRAPRRVSISGILGTSFGYRFLIRFDISTAVSYGDQYL